MAIKMLNSRFARMARDAGDDTGDGTGGGGSAGEEGTEQRGTTGTDDGGDEGDDTGDDSDGGDEGDEENPKPKPSAKAWKPPTQTEWEATQAKLRNVNAESAKRRTELKSLKQKYETDTERAERETEERVAARYKPTAIKASARSALLEANAKPERIGALAGLLKMDDLDINEDGEVTGLDAEVVRVAKEYPEFFLSEQEEKPAPKTKPGKVTAIGKPAPPKEKAPWDLIAERING